MSAVRNLAKSLGKQSPTILAVISVAGVIGSVAAAIKATPAAMNAIEREEVFRHEEYSDDRPLEPVDILKVTWRYYIPTATVALTTIGCIVASTSISNRRIAVMGSIINLAESSLSKYRAAVIEEVGQKKENLIRGNLANKEVSDNPPDLEHVIQTNQGATLCRDGISGRYFYSDIDFIKRVVNEYNKRLLNEMTLPLNELYADLYLPPIDIGGQLGWDIDHGLLELDCLPGMTPDGLLCAVLSYKNMPTNIR